MAEPVTNIALGHPIEVEFRARFDESTHKSLMEQLAKEATDMGEDDKIIHFFPLPEKLIKVTINQTKGSAKVTYKGGRIGTNDTFSELEYPIAVGDVDKAVAMFLALGHGELYHVAENRRHNFSYRNVEIALKWSEAWGYHAEFELMLEPGAAESQVAAATKEIQRVADELGVKLMSRQDLAEFERKFEAAQRSLK